ncbi:fibronectin type III domain-containing protein [Microvirga sp. STS02]|uniref:fibronectin type III domain-containing protein n=1 Tax=Hymenobacter negativus TaxID=2795026 RepID=UPI0018DBAAA1|nr:MULTISPECIES: fibronectin type III domain-containing protein [Bacteria]MBH8569922.1 fibronectin type III domain-containing protein [Hymenobacter negativus]MBR7209661.1 fibronectin type III domain-containing protein [Microvirga sp. STS02]
MLKLLLAAGSTTARKRGLGLHVALLLLTGVGLPFGAWAQSVPVAQWALTSNNASTYTAPGLTAGTPTLKRLVASANATVLANSATYGQATAPTADGLWTTPGGTLSRKYYQQFTITAGTASSVRLDSLVLTEAYYATGSNAKLAVVFSKTGFTTNDSTEIAGTGTVNNGALTFPSTGLGGFAKAVAVAQNNAGPTAPTNTYRLALNTTGGVTLAAGQTLSIRLYNSCGSTSNGKYVMLKNLAAVGQVLSVGTITTTTAQVSFATPAAGGYTYGISTSPAGGTAALTTAPSVGNNYVATYTLSGLTSATAYAATVTATPAGSPAGPTVPAITSPTFTTTNANCPDVSSVAVGSITQTGASVSFTPGSGNASFVVTYTPSGGSTTTVSPNPTASPVALTGLTGGTAYTVTVQSVCASGSGTAQATTFTTLTCADPSGLAVSGITSTSASLAFTPGSGNSSYTVSYYPTGSPGAAMTVSPAPTASPVALSGLTPATNYTVTLQSTCANGAVGNVLTRTFTTRLTSSPVLQQFPLTANASDDPTVRSAGVTASTATLTPSTTTPLVLSDGSSKDGESTYLPAYSALGQGIAPNADGTGWNGTVSLTRYEEFTVTAAPGGSVRADSLVFSAGGYGSTMNVSVAYSTDGFATAGTFIAGSQATPVALNKVSSNGYSVLRLPLAGTTGVTVAAGNIISFRLYYALGTSSNRHALTKNLYVTGVATAACPAATALSISNVTAAGAQLNFTPGAGNTSYTVTLTPQGGTTTTLTPAPTASPVALTGLDASTTYTATLQTNCGGTPGYVQSVSFTTPAANSAVLQQWPLTADNTDNALVRSYAVAASTPTLAGLAASTNTASSSPPIPANSTTYAQAVAPAGNGGGWSSSLSTTVYEEFTLTAASGDNLRVDSLTFATAFYNTGNGRIAVAYSLDGFGTSSFVLGTLGAPATANNYNSSGFGTYRLALGGLTRSSGQTLSVRFYYAAGTSSSGRYALLRNVYFSGEGFVNNLPNLTIGDTRSVANGTTYGNVTVLPGGTATLGGPLAAQGAITVQSGGILNTNCQPVTGPATFALNAGAELQICAPAGIAASGSTGAVQVTGTRTFSSDAIYTYTGTFTNGANQQSGSGLPATVRSLKVNLATATDSLQLNSDVTVNTSLVLSRGVLKGYLPDGSGAHLLTLGRNATISETATSFVLGQVQSATLSFVADGNSTGFGGLGLTLTAHTAGGAALPGSIYVVRTTGTPVYGVTPAAGANAGITSRSIRRQYRIVPTTETGLNMDLVFGYSPTTAELNGIPAANLQLFSRPIAGGLWRPEGGTASANTITLTGLTHLSDWTLGNKAAPLPVTLTRFDAERQGQQALLTWATATEQNSKGFAVQASADGREFRTLGFVPSRQASSQAQSYQFLTAADNLTGTVYFRLQQVDLDGSSTFTAPKAVVFGTGNASILTASPNPFGETLTLTTQAASAGVVPLTFTDATGRTVLKQLVEVPAGLAKLPIINLSSLPRGMYVLHITLDGKAQHLKLVKE